MPGRIERALTLGILLVTACTVLPPARTPVHPETRRVAIPGEEADTLAETTGEAENGIVPVRTHDGRELWVREGALGGASLVPGTWVLLRQSGLLVTVAVARSLDDFVEVDAAGTRTVVPVGDVVARLHHGPAVAETVMPPPPVTPPLPAPTPLGQMAVLEATSTSRTAMLGSCSGGSAAVTYPDGTVASVAMTAIHPLRVQAGDRVMALWSGTPYAAVILDTRDSLVHARWEDGSDQWIERTDVQSVDGEVTGRVSGCPHRAVLVEEPPRVRVGRVLACEGGQATVMDAAGLPRTVSRESLSRVSLRVGDAVRANWNGTPYDAIVLALGDRFHVRWSDGTENDVDPADLVSVAVHEDRASEAVACPDV